jgi:hypothetical protein
MELIGGVHFDRSHCIIGVMCLSTLLQIYIYTYKGKTIFCMELWPTPWNGAAYVVCFMFFLYLGWDVVPRMFGGGMLLLINILYTLYCTRCESIC